MLFFLLTLFKYIVIFHKNMLWVLICNGFLLLFKNELINSSKTCFLFLIK